MPENRAGAQEAERRAIARVLETGDPKPVVETKEESVPDVEWLKRDQTEFDFLDFSEGERLLAAARGERRTVILTALRTGMRHGELDPLTVHV